MQRVSTHESRFHEIRKERYRKRFANVKAYSMDSDEKEEVDLAEWTRNKSPIFGCWIKVSHEKFSFDVTKADKIFDVLLEKGQLQLSPNYTISLAKELNKNRYFKFHNLISHDTFGQQIQSTI